MVKQPPRAAAPVGDTNATLVATLTLGVTHGALMVTVRVTPRASRDALTIEDGLLRVRLRAAPVDGAANTALIVLLAERLGLPRRDIAITQGESARVKRIAIEGLTADDFRQRIATALN